MYQELLFADSIAVDEEKVWLIALRLNILMEIERDTGIISPCGIIPSNRRIGISYRCLIKHEKYIYLFPYEEKDICIYDTEKKSFEYMALNLEEQESRMPWRFTGCVKIDNKIVVYGGSSIVLLIDPFTLEIHYLNLKKKLPSNLKEEYWFWKYSYISEKKVFLIPQSCPCVIEWDVSTEEVKCNEIPEKNSVCIDSFAFDGKDLYYIDRKKGDTVILTKYNMQSKILEMYDLGIEKSEIQGTFGFMTYINGGLWMLPGIGEVGYRYCKGNLEKMYALPTVVKTRLQKEFPHEFNYRNGFLTENGHVLTVHAWSCQLVDINTIDGNIQITPILKNKNIDWSELLKNFFDISSNGVYEEWMSEMLESFLCKVIFGEQTGNDILENVVGNKIYRVLSRNS